jgi:hypothetical protein
VKDEQPGCKQDPLPNERSPPGLGYAGMLQIRHGVSSR